MVKNKSFDLADGLENHSKEDSSEEGALDKAYFLLKNMFDNLNNLKTPVPPKLAELRASGLPFCPIKSFLFNSRAESYSMDHYVTTGHAIHSTLQKWLPMGDYSRHVWGNWECTQCNHLFKHQLKPALCRKCSQDNLKYREVDLKYKNLTLHIDMILQVDLGNKENGFVVVDFKTTDMERKRSNFRWDPNKPSSSNYIVQIRTYCTMLEHLLGLKIVGWLLPSVNRASPIKSSNDYSILSSGEWSTGKTKRWLKFLDAANDSYMDYLSLMKLIGKKDKPAINKALKTMIRYRPCHSVEDYDRWMSFAYYGKDKCPLKEICCHQSDSSVREAIISEVKKLR